MLHVVEFETHPVRVPSLDAYPYQTDNFMNYKAHYEFEQSLF